MPWTDREQASRGNKCAPLRWRKQLTRIYYFKNTFWTYKQVNFTPPLLIPSPLFVSTRSATRNFLSRRIPLSPPIITFFSLYGYDIHVVGQIWKLSLYLTKFFIFYAFYLCYRNYSVSCRDKKKYVGHRDNFKNIFIHKIMYSE